MKIYDLVMQCASVNKLIHKPTGKEFLSPFAKAICFANIDFAETMMQWTNVKTNLSVGCLHVSLNYQPKIALWILKNEDGPPSHDFTWNQSALTIAMRRLKNKPRDPLLIDIVLHSLHCQPHVFDLFHKCGSDGKTAGEVLYSIDSKDFDESNFNLLISAFERAEIRFECYREKIAEILERVFPDVIVQNLIFPYMSSSSSSKIN